MSIFGGRNNKARSITYQLTDPYIYFSNKIQDKCNYQDENYWSHTINTSSFHSWSGFAFEQLCLNHLPQIKEALGISGVQTAIYCWRENTQEGKGAQIDLVIESKAANTDYLCEMKFSGSRYSITADYEQKLQNKVDAFAVSKMHKDSRSIQVVLITTMGLVPGSHSFIINQTLTLENLFS